jgi:hypothetical protein
MTDEQLQATIWRHWPTRGSKAVFAVDAILAAARAYADSVRPEPGGHRPACPCHVLHHTSDTDLYPVIGVLAEALLGEDSEQEAAA